MVSPRESGRRETGYLMVGMVAAVAILMIFSTLALQEWIEVLRRDNEAEMMFRAQDIVRAIQRYRRDHGGSPPMRMADLMEPGPRSQYYLRRLWKDPLVKDGKWGLLYAGPAGEVIDPNATSAPVEPGQPGSGQPFPSPGLSNPFASPAPAPAPGAAPGQAQMPGFGQPASTPFGISAGATDPSGGGKQVGGLPLAGVRTLAQDTPFRVYNDQTEYSRWLFTFFDLERVQLPGGQSATPTQPPLGSPFGNRPGFGRRPGFGNR
jgi:type II secretory pathway pseudopilin PulG